MEIEKRIESLGLSLPVPPEPRGSYVPLIIVDDIMYLSGLLPLRNGRLLYSGKVGRDIGMEEAKRCSEEVVLNALSIIKSHTGDLDRIERFIRLNGYINAVEEFRDHPSILNSASELIVRIFGDRGVHTRIAIGVSSLPLDSPLEMDMIIKVR